MTEPAAASHLIRFVDAAFPPVPDIGEGVAFYIGGDATHAWTDEEIAAAPQRYRLPIYVRSNPPGPGPSADVAAAVTRLQQIGAPEGTLVAWDMETAEDAAYIAAVYRLLRKAGWELIVYGSQGYVFGNDNPDGLYWGADWMGQPRIMPGDVITQFVSLKVCDESVAGDAPGGKKHLPLWDTRRPPPQPFPPGRHVASGGGSLAALAARQKCDVTAIWRTTFAGLDATVSDGQPGDLERAYLDRGDWHAPLPAGLVLWLP